MTTSAYAWLGSPEWAGFEQAFSLTFVKNVDAGAVIAMLGRVSLVSSVPTPLQELPGMQSPSPAPSHQLIGATTVSGWTVLCQQNGDEASTPETVERLSQGTEALAVFTNINRVSRFVYCRDGAIIVEFDPLFPDERRGNEPDRLRTAMQQVGLDFIDDGDDDPVWKALELADMVTGVHIDGDVLAGPLLWGMVLNDPAVNRTLQSPNDHPLRTRDPELAQAIDAADTATLARAVALYLRHLVADAEAEEEHVIGQVLVAVERHDTRRLSELQPSLAELFATWSAEAASLPELHQIDRRRDTRSLARLRLASARKALERVVTAALAPSPVAGAFEVFESINRYAGPTEAERHREIMTLLGEVDNGS